MTENNTRPTETFNSESGPVGAGSAFQPKGIAPMARTASGETSLSCEYIVKSKESKVGGMGKVFEAFHTPTNRLVALKVIRDSGAEEEPRAAALSNLLQWEAQVTARLEHPGIIPIYDIGTLPPEAVAAGTGQEAIPFYSMPMIPNSTWNIAGQKLQDNLQILLRICDAIAYAHENGVLHLDLKPENVILGKFGEVFVIDWGLSASIGADAAECKMARPLSLFGSGSIGTSSYAAPELAQGNLGAISVRTDVYLLGAILFKIVNGKAPHDSWDDATVNVIHPAAEHSGVDSRLKEELHRTALKALGTDPEQRQPSVAAFRTNVESARDRGVGFELLRQAVEECDKGDAAASIGGDAKDAVERGYERALALADSAAASLADHPDLKMCRKQIVVAYAKCCLAANKLEQAEALLQKYLKELPGDDEIIALNEETSKRIKLRDKEARNGRMVKTIATVAACVVVTALFMAVYLWYMKTEADARAERGEMEVELANAQALLEKEKAAGAAERERLAKMREADRQYNLGMEQRRRPGGRTDAESSFKEAERLFVELGRDPTPVRLARWDIDYRAQSVSILWRIPADVVRLSRGVLWAFPDGHDLAIGQAPDALVAMDITNRVIRYDIKLEWVGQWVLSPNAETALWYETTREDDRPFFEIFDSVTGERRMPSVKLFEEEGERCLAVANDGTRFLNFRTIPEARLEFIVYEQDATESLGFRRETIPLGDFITDALALDKAYFLDQDRLVVAARSPVFEGCYNALFRKAGDSWEMADSFDPGQGERMTSSLLSRNNTILTVMHSENDMSWTADEWMLEQEKSPARRRRVGMELSGNHTKFVRLLNAMFDEENNRSFYLCMFNPLISRADSMSALSDWYTVLMEANSESDVLMPREAIGRNDCAAPPSQDAVSQIVPFIPSGAHFSVNTNRIAFGTQGGTCHVFYPYSKGAAVQISQNTPGKLWSPISMNASQNGQSVLAVDEIGNAVILDADTWSVTNYSSCTGITRRISLQGGVQFTVGSDETTGSFHYAGLSPNGDKALFRRGTKNVLWNIADASIEELPLCTEEVAFLRLTADNRCLAFTRSAILEYGDGAWNPVQAQFPAAPEEYGSFFTVSDDGGRLVRTMPHEVEPSQKWNESGILEGWDPIACKRIWSYEYSGMAVGGVWSSDYRYFALKLMGGRHEVVILDGNSGAELARIDDLSVFTGAQLAFSPDNSYLAMSGMEQQLRLWFNTGNEWLECLRWPQEQASVLKWAWYHIRRVKMLEKRIPVHHGLCDPLVFLPGNKLAFADTFGIKSGEPLNLFPGAKIERELEYRELFQQEPVFSHLILVDLEKAVEELRE